jgi:replicative superfamily II helicase
MSKSEVTSEVYQQILTERKSSITEKILKLFKTPRVNKEEFLYHESKAIKVALVMEKWLQGIGLREIEDEFCVSAGQVVSAGQRLAWLMDATAGIAEMMNLSISKFFKTLSECLRWGVPPEMLFIARENNLYFTRSILLNLHKAGLNSWEKIHNASMPELLEILPKDMARLLKGISQRIVAPSKEENLQSIGEELKKIVEVLTNKNDSIQKKSKMKKTRTTSIIEEIWSEVEEASHGVWNIKRNNGIL